MANHIFRDTFSMITLSIYLSSHNILLVLSKDLVIILIKVFILAGASENSKVLSMQKHGKFDIGRKGLLSMGVP